MMIPKNRESSCTDDVTIVREGQVAARHINIDGLDFYALPVDSGFEASRLRAIPSVEQKPAVLRRDRISCTLIVVAAVRRYLQTLRDCSVRLDTCEEDYDSCGA